MKGQAAAATTAGRGPSERVRAVVMDSARALIDEAGFSGLTMDALAVHAGVSKATIYRWWSNRADVAMDALLDVAGPNERYLHAGSALSNLTSHVRIAAEFIGGPNGHALAGVVADAQHSEDLADAFRTRYWERRRALIVDLMRDAVARNELSAGVDLEVLADLLIGPMYYRLLVGHLGVTDSFAGQIIETVVGPYAM